MVTRVPIYLGGTGESTQAAAQAALGLHTSNSVAFTTVTIGAVNVLANDYATLLSAYSNDVTTLATARGNDHATLLSAYSNDGATLATARANDHATYYAVLTSPLLYRVDTSTEGGEIAFARAVDNTSAWSIDVFGTLANTSLRFIDTAKATERMRIDTSGNVGIGTGSPVSKLQIGSAIAANNATYVGSIQLNETPGSLSAVGGLEFKTSSFGAGYGWKTISIDTGGGVDLLFATRQNSGTWNESMRLTGSGNVGIGTSSPTFKFVAASSSTDGGWLYSSGANSILGLGGYSGGADGASSIRYDRSTGVITFNGGTRDTPAERMRIDGSGNIGIGTTSPAATLDVVGTFSDAKANTVQQTLTDAATIAWDASLGRVATVTLGASRTFGAPTNLKVGTYILHVIQGGTGSYTITWNGVFKWTAATAPTLSTAVGRRDIFSFISDGTNLYGAMIPDVR